MNRVGRDSVWEKSSFNQVDSKLASVFDGVFVRVRTNNSFGYLKCSNPNKTPSNAVANFESTRLKTRLFSNTVSSNNGVFKGKVFEQNETLQPIGKVIKKILIRKQNYAWQKPNNNMQSLDYITRYCVYFVLLEVNMILKPKTW